VTLTASAVLAQPGRCVECLDPLTSESVVALCPTCCPHSRQFIVADDCRDGANGRMHLDCIACGAEVEMTEPDEDGTVGYETLVPIHTGGLR
jgi:hypothetical protein